MATTTETVVREHELELVVAEAAAVADDVVALTLVHPDGEPLQPWTPGAHVDLVLDESTVRQYSLAGSPAQEMSYRVAVLKEPHSRGGSQRVHEHLRAGERVRVRGPRNHFPLVSAPRYVFIAGGIGITPMLPMLAEAEASGVDWHLYYGGRRRGSMAFADELARYGDKVTLVPQDEAGMLDLEQVVGSARPGTAIYCCGPEGLIGAVESRCADLPAGTLHLERFAPKPQEPNAGGDEAFELVLHRSGTVLQVPPDKSVFQVVREAGVSVLGSCLEGTCGTCETDVVDGDVDHRDSVLDAEEQASNETMMICVSRCRSGRLTLDL